MFRYDACFLVRVLAAAVRDRFHHCTSVRSRCKSNGRQLRALRLGLSDLSGGVAGTFTYYRSLEIEKLIKIVFWAQIDSSQALEAGKCDFDSFCFAYSHGKLFARL